MIRRLGLVVLLVVISFTATGCNLLKVALSAGAAYGIYKAMDN